MKKVARRFTKGNTLFVISNDTSGAESWQPRKIHPFSCRKDEYEALYPAGAEFLVTKVDNGKTPQRNKTQAYEASIKRNLLTLTSFYLLNFVTIKIQM